MKIRFTKLAIVLLLTVLVLAFTAGIAMAGDGDGSGGGSNEPLTLASSSLPDGSVDVPTDVSITLTFSKNVVKMAVRDNNMACFSMTSADGTSVPISVIMGDDQVDPSIKRIVNIEAYGLAPGTAYTLTIGGGVTSKSGVSLGYPVYISFTTKAAEEAPAPAAEPAPAPAAPAVTEPSSQPETTEPEAKPEETTEPEDEETPEESKDEEPAKDSEVEEKPSEQTAEAEEILTVGADEAEPAEAESSTRSKIWILFPAAAVVAASAFFFVRRKKDNINK